MINADDLGMSENVNAAICEAFEKGLIDRTTLMTNMPYAREAMKLAKEKGFLPNVGIHLNLTSGRPLTEGIRSDAVMCGENGEFTGDFARSLLTRFFLPKETVKHVDEEIRAQLDMYAELGGTLWHIDSHHHVHTDPSVFGILKKVMRDYPVTGIRLSRNMYSGGNPLMRIYKALFNRSARKLCRVKPDYFGSLYDYETFVTGHPHVAEHETEIMVHPVFDDKGVLCDVHAGGYSELQPRAEAVRKA